MEKGSLTIVSGFSGAGKGTIMKELLKRYDSYRMSVSCTTRAPRPGETHGKEYYFISQEEFDSMAENGEFLEHAGYAGNSYGTPKKFVEDQIAQGHDVLLEIEVQGAAQVKKKCPDAIMLFVAPPSAEVLKKRLRGRGTESEEKISLRLLQACREVDEIEKYDVLIVNDDLDAAVEEVNSAIQILKKAPGRNKEWIAQLSGELSGFGKK